MDWNAFIRVYLQVPQKSLNTFNIITTELIGSDIRRIQINNWQNNNQDICDCKIVKIIGDCISLIFSGRDWSVEIILKSLLFQRNTTYLEDNKE